MKLATRMSLFFLMALAIVLAGFSASMYCLVRYHLFSQFEQRSNDALGTLTAAIESGPNGLEWEVSERNINLRQAENKAPLAWAVFDGQGTRVDGSTDREGALELSPQIHGDVERWTNDVTCRGAPWRITYQLIRSKTTNAVEAGDAVESSAAQTANRYPILELAVGSSLGSVTGQLQTLAFVLTGLSLGIWSAAALAGRWFCRTALAPLTSMTSAIAEISAVDLGERVMPVTSGDEMEELSLAFNELLDRLQRSFERQRRFAAEASHQLRTPLTAMQGQLEVTLRRERSPGEYLQTLKTVESQAANLRRIVEMLLVMTREPDEASHTQFEPLELNTWLGEHVSSWHRHPRACDLQVESACAPSLWVRAHAGLLGQAIDNLWDNACKYSNPQTPIKIQTMRVEDDIRLIVADGGHGMAEQEVSCVTDPFYRSDDARARGIEGTGLGLAIVTRIVSAFGAKLHIESDLGRGSVFTIHFPVAAR